MQHTGQVIRKPFAAGSKSERPAVMLQTGDGEYVLRIQGGNPFHDPRLEELVGKQIVVVANLETAKLRGLESQGMLLAASDEGRVILLTPESPVQAGAQVK